MKKIDEKELFGVVYSAIPYNTESLVLSDYEREEIADQIIPELVKLMASENNNSYLTEIQDRLIYRLQQEFPEKHDLVKSIVEDHFEKLI